MGKLKDLLKESKYKVTDLHKGQIVKIDPNAEVSYSYKEGLVPSNLLKYNTWLVDAIDYESGILNIHSLDPVPGDGEIGGACSFVYYEDIIDITR